MTPVGPFNRQVREEYELWVSIGWSSYPASTRLPTNDICQFLSMKYFATSTGSRQRCLEYFQ